MENNSFSFIYIYHNRKFLIITFFIGVFLSIGATFFIPKKYLSTAIIYPANSHTRNDIVGNPQFGFETETEQLLQLLESKNMRDRTMEEFDLVSYYEMDTTKPDWKTHLDLKYIDDVTFSRSKYLSVVISVKTENPELSAKIANFQIDEVNAYRDAIFLKNRQQELNSVKENLAISEKKCKLLRDTIYSIKKGDEKLIFNFMENLNNEDYDASEFVDDPKLEPIIEQYIFEQALLQELRTSHNNLEVQMNRPMPAVYTIDRAFPAYKKVSPSFLLNAVLGGFCLMLLSLTLMIVRKEVLSIKSKEANPNSAL